MNRIKFLREEKGIYQKDLANLLNVSVPAINYYENEKRSIDTETASILADYFNVSIDYLLGKSDVRNVVDNKTEEDPLGLAQIGFSMKDYNPPTETQKEQIRSLIEVILKDNKKDTEDKK